MLHMGRCALVGEESRVLLGPRRRPDIQPLSSHLIWLRFFYVGKYFSGVVVSLVHCSQVRIGNLGTRAIFPEGD